MHLSSILLLLFLVAAEAAVIRHPTHIEKKGKSSESEESKESEESEEVLPTDDIPDGLDMVHVNVIWRHGDRSPTSAMVGDQVTEASWTFGGGGWGELSPIGMAQQFRLGKKLFDRYALNNTYLSETYRSNEIYVYSTDFNRTLVSAMASLAGMYSRSTAKVDRDYPDIPDWPTNFVPVPIHTELSGKDHIGDPSAKCPRQDDLLRLVMRTNDYKEASGPEAQEVLEYLRNATGAPASKITFDNVYKIADNMMIEGIWFPENVSTWYPYYTEEIREKVEDLVTKGLALQNGIIVDKIQNGVDLSQEIPTIRGGPLVNDIMAKARGVIQCRRRDSNGQVNGCKDSDKFYRNLKYHAISAHDSTIDAYLTVLGAKLNVSPGNPKYTASLLTEFFIDTRNGGTEQVFRVLYHEDENADFRVITPEVEGCDDDFCPIQVLQNIANKLKPPGGIEQLCLQRIPL
ncbi:hypothetical protein PFISCL1PPCAC_6513 [Pristionchus fissidentatus]|uniref:acid phosphatase n=1 Tax=Pristionchus fissidentatus TaxID=1538716 RepID=A0AAV5V8Z5_9BILA|nr:hypothetical protein PFISCL1PPCAC_6513 [Pristionchus fissidentatus]